MNKNLKMSEYLKDNYQKEFTATITEINNGKYIVLDKTLFYPSSGGQPHDTGKLIKDNQEYNVIYVGKFNNKTSHEVDKQGLKQGDKLKGIINWERRYLLMKHHTAAHVLSKIIQNKTKALITGNQLNIDKSRIDFDLENFDKEKMQEYISEANKIIKKELEVKKYFMQSEEAFKKPELFSLKDKLPPDVKELRIVEIENFDISACGGTHVNNLKEIGEIVFLKAENKGKGRRRVYYTLK